MTQTETNTARYAHAFKVAGGYEVYFTATPKLSVQGAMVKVSNKREARAMAVRFNATPWNF